MLSKYHVWTFVVVLFAAAIAAIGVHIFLNVVKKDDNVGLTASNCAVTDANADNKSFIFKCGLTIDEIKQHQVDIPKDFNKKQVCEIAIDSGMPTYFNCSEMPETIESFINKGASLVGSWDCEGLDGYGENEETLILRINELGEFAIELPAKTNTDSIWFIKNSEMSGSYSTSEAKLRLIPETWTNELIATAGLKLEDAPDNIIKKPKVINIQSLTKTELKGKYSVVSGYNTYSYALSCEKTVDDIHQTAK